MNISKKTVKWYFYSLPFVDLITSLTTTFMNTSLSIGMIVKGITILFFIFYIYFINKNKYRKATIIYYSILFLFFSLYFLFKIDIWSVHNILYELKFILKIFYFPIMIVGLFNLFKNIEINTEDIRQILVKTLWMYTILLLIPYITGTGFQSYKYEGGVGNNGWFFAANEIGAILILLFSIVYLDFKSKKVLPCILTLIPAFAIAIIGTKVSTLGILIECVLLLVSLFINSSDKKIIKIFVIVGIAYISLLFSPAKSNVSFAIKRYDNEITKQTEKIKNENKTLVSDNNKWDAEKDSNTENAIIYPTVNSTIKNPVVKKIISVGLSERGDFLLKNNYTYIRSGIKNIMFGMGWSDRQSINYTYSRKMVEIDFFDILFHYGIIGIFVYIMPLIYVLILFFKNIKTEYEDKIYYFMILLLMFGISTLSGHILTAPAASIYLALLIMLMISKKGVE